MIGSEGRRHILACAALHSSGLGGAERSHVERTSDLHAEHVAIHSLIPAPDLGLGRTLRAAGSSVTLVPSSPWWIGTTELPSSGDPEQPLDRFVSRSAVHAVMKTMAEIRPDIILTVTGVNPHAAIAASGLGIPHVWFLSELAVPAHGLFPTVPHRHIGRAISQLSDRVVCVSRRVRSQFFGELTEEEFLGRGIHVIHDAPRMSSPVTATSAGPGRVAASREMRIGVIGTFVRGKGQALAISALARAVRRGKPVRMTLFGSGPDEAAAQLRALARAEGVADLVDLRYVEDLQSLYSDVDVVAVTSVDEGFGRVPFEAAAARRPILYAEEGALTEFMIPERTGLAFHPGDADSLADAIGRLADEPELGRRLAATAHRELAAFAATPPRGEQVRAVLEQALARERFGPWRDLAIDLRASAFAPGSSAGEPSESDEDLLALRAAYERMQTRLGTTLKRRPVRAALLVSDMIRAPRSTLRGLWDRSSRLGGNGPFDSAAYSAWRRSNERAVSHQQQLVTDRVSEPQFSLVIPVCDPSPEVLEAALRSIRDQHHQDWQIIAVDDASENVEVASVLRDASEIDPRIIVVRNAARSGISDSTNRGVALARGRWIGFVDHDDLLDNDVLRRCAETLARVPEARMLYTDEDKIDERGRLCHPRFKSGLDRVRLLHENYINHLTMYRRDLLDAVGPLGTTCDGSQDWDLAIRAIEILPDDHIVHVEHVGYHWRQAASQFSRSQGHVAQAAGLMIVNREVARAGAPLIATPHPSVKGAVSLVPSDAVRTDVTVIVLVQNVTPQGLRRTAQNLRAWRRDGISRVVLACGSEEAGGRVSRELDTSGVEATIVIVRGGTLGELLERAAATVTTPMTVVADESLRPDTGMVVATLRGYLALRDVGLVAPRVLGIWGMLEHGPILVSGDGLVVTGRDVDATLVGYFGEFAVPQQVAALGSLCFAVTSDVLRDACRALGAISDVTDLAMRVSLVTWQSSRSVVWVPTISARRRPRDGDAESHASPDAHPHQVSELLAVDSEVRRLPRLPAALRVHNGALVLGAAPELS